MLKVRRRKAIKKKVMLIAAGIAAVLIWSDQILTDHVRDFADIAIKQQMANKITNLIQSYTTDSGFLVLSQDDMGNITNVQVDVAELTKLKASVSNDLNRYFANTDNYTATIRLGSVFRSAFMQIFAPKIKLRYYPVSSAILKESTEFVSAGVNQSLHRVILKVDMDFVCVSAGQKMKFNFSNDFVIAENIIVGQVPAGVLIGE